MPELGLIRPPLPASPKSDWLVALDDLLCQRVTRCALCGRESRPQLYAGIWDLTARRSVAYVVCVACHSQTAWETTLRDRLAARYGHHGQDQKEQSYGPVA